MQARARAPEHARHVVERGVRVRLVLEQVHVRVEEVALRHVYTLEAEFVDEGEDAGCDDRFFACRERRERALRSRVLQHDAVELGDVDLVALGPGGDVEGEALACTQRRT